jgi:hypothetical protein
VITILLKQVEIVSEIDPLNGNDTAANRVLLDNPDNRLDPKGSDHAVTVRIELS